MLATLTFPAIPDLHCAHGPVALAVHSADELRRALRAARERALALDVSALNRLLRLDGERRQIELQAATPWSALAEYLGERGAAPEAVAVLGRRPGCVGDDVSANAPGPDGAPFVRHIEAITLVTAEGDLRRADRATHADLFRLAVGGHGLIGVLYSVTLRIDSLLDAAARAHEPVVLDLGQPAQPGGIARAAEFLVPPARLDDVLAGFKQLAAERRIALQSISVRKLQAEDETLLCWATREWAGVTLRYAMRPTLGACVHATEIERLFLEIVLAHGGSFPIGALHLATLAQLDACYPRLGEFIAEKRLYDPAERLQTAWYRRVSALLPGEIQLAAAAE